MGAGSLIPLETYENLSLNTFSCICIPHISGNTERHSNEHLFPFSLAQGEIQTTATKQAYLPRKASVYKCSNARFSERLCSRSPPLQADLAGKTYRFLLFITDSIKRKPTSCCRRLWHYLVQILELLPY